MDMELERGGTAVSTEDERAAGVAWTLAVLRALSMKEADGDLRELLRHGAWVDSCVYLPEEDAMDANGVVPRNKVRCTTALIEAAGAGRLALASLLLDHGADAARIENEDVGDGGPCADQATALMRAAVDGNLEMVNLLLLRGKHAIDFQDPDTGASAYSYACARNHPDVVEALIRAGCDTHAKCRCDVDDGMQAGSTSKLVTGVFVAYFQGHYSVVQRIFCVLNRHVHGPVGAAAGVVLMGINTKVADWHDAKTLLMKMDLISHPERARLYRVAEMAKEVGNAALKRKEPTEAVRQYTLAIDALRQSGAGSVLVAPQTWEIPPSVELLATCLTNRGVARLAESADAVLAAEPMADFRAAIAANRWYGKGYYRAVKTMLEQMKASGWSSPAEIPEPERSRFVKEFVRTLEVGCHVVKPSSKPIGPLLHRMLEECGAEARQPPQLPNGVLVTILRHAFGSKSWRMNVLNRELRDALAHEPRQLKLASNIDKASGVMVWYHHGEEDGRGQKWGTPYLDEGWAQRLVPRSTGWKLVVTGGGASRFSDGRVVGPDASCHEDVYQAMATLSTLPFSEVVVTADFVPRVEPPYKSRAAETSEYTRRLNSCLHEWVAHRPGGLKSLDAQYFDLDPAVLVAWAESGNAKHATALRLESVARVDMDNFAEFSAALLSFISAAHSLEVLELPLLGRNPATLRPVIDLVCRIEGSEVASKQLRELNLKHCNLGFEGAMVALRWTQQESCQLTSLNLNSTFSLEGVESVKLLVDACRGRDRPALTALDLTQCLNKVDEDDGDPYADQGLFSLPETVLRPGWALQSLDLSHQPDYMLCDVVVDCICQAMQQQHERSTLGCQLRKLMLTGGMVGDDGACQLAGIAKEPWSQLQVLALDSNSIGDRGVLGFAAAVSSPANQLKRLYLHGSDDSVGHLGMASMLAAVMPDQDSKRDTCHLELLTLPECDDEFFELADSLSEALDRAGVEFRQE